VGTDPLAASGPDHAPGPQASAGEEASGLIPGPGDASPTAGLIGRWLTAPGAVVLATPTAQRLGLTPGRSFELRIAGRPFTAVFLASPGEAGAPRSLLLTDIAQAQEWLGLVGRLTHIELAAPQGPESEAALARLRAQLPPGVRLAPAQQRANASLGMLQAFTTNLHAMSLLGLLVGVFLIYGAVSFAVVQRRRALATLRALGATRAELLALTLLEAAVLGLAGGLLGVAAGVLLGKGLLKLVARTINDLYFMLEVTRVDLSPGMLIGACAAGLAAALVAALLPALEAAFTTPQLGLRRSNLESRAVAIARALAVASIVLAAGAALLIAGSSRSLLAGFAALFLLLLSVAALAPALLRAAARGAARALARVSPIARLALGDVAASMSRTGVAVAALGMALAAMIGVAVMVESFRGSLAQWLVETLRADLYVTAPGPGLASPERQIDPQVLAAMLRVPGIRDHSTGRRVSIASADGPVTLDAVGVAPETYASVRIVSGDAARAWQAFGHGAILMAEPIAWRLDLHAGQSLALATPAGMRPFRIAGIYREYGNDRGGVVMSADEYRRVWGDDAVSSLGLYLAPGVSPEQAIARIYAAAGARQELLIASNADIRALSMEIFERTFTVTKVLYWLTAIVAALGLASVLTAWQLERSRELAMLRTLGLTPRGAALLIQAQTLFMGLVALLAAIPAGLASALLLVLVINRRAFGWHIDFHLNGAALLDALVLALLAAGIAGLYPAWRSARVTLASEVREE